MTTLVVGASGATGQKLVEQLLSRGGIVKAVVRSTDSLPTHILNHPNLQIIQAAILDVTDAELLEQVKGCNAVASCLGHNMTFKGIYGRPRWLVADATRKLCDAIKANCPEQPVRYVLMNTTGNTNRDIAEKISFGQTLVIWLLRLLLPPHVDNEKAADYLRTEIGQNSLIEWVAVRPDDLIDDAEISDYELHPSPIRSAIFDSGQTSRINVGEFMAELMTKDDLWQTWKGQMPVIYNKEPSQKSH